MTNPTDGRKESAAQVLPCPFCGGEASDAGEVKYDAKYAEKEGWKQSTFFYCNCIECGSDNKGIVGHHTKSDAVAAWNRRAALSVEQAPQPVPTEVAWKDGFIVGQAQPGMDAHWVWMQRRDALRTTPTEAPPVESQAAEIAKKVISAWEALPGGCNYSPKVVESWLIHHMAPMIAEMRALAAEGSAE